MNCTVTEVYHIKVSSSSIWSYYTPFSAWIAHLRTCSSKSRKVGEIKLLLFSKKNLCTNYCKDWLLRINSTLKKRRHFEKIKKILFLLKENTRQRYMNTKLCSKCVAFLLSPCKNCVAFNNSPLYNNCVAFLFPLLQNFKKTHNIKKIVEIQFRWSRSSCWEQWSCHSWWERSCCSWWEQSLHCW